MGIASTHELARTTEGEVGRPTVAVRRWAVVLSNDTLQNNPTTVAAISTALVLDNWGLAHVELSFLWLRKVVFTERFQDSPYHVEVVAEWGGISANELLAPTSRTAEWSFETQPGQVPALYWWDGTTRRPLVNSANDYFEGLTVEEQMVRVTIRKNYAALPSAQIVATNSINSDGYLGCPSHTWKVAGVNTSFVTELHNSVSYSFWSAECELLYRQSGWNLQLPDVGWNYLDGSQKRRAMVFDFENSEWVASPNPVALNGSGAQSSAFPAILERRVNTEANFLSLFGTPPS
jgi:hypothetical protein